MNEFISQPWVAQALPLATFIVCLISGLVPIINAEIYLLAITPLIKSPSMVMWVGFSAGLGQVGAKAMLYLVANRAVDLPLIRKKVNQQMLEEWSAKMQTWGWKLPIFTFCSAFFGFPPFLVVSFILGAMRINFVTFFVTGLTGRVLRFTLLVAAPSWIQSVLHFPKGS